MEKEKKVWTIETLRARAIELEKPFNPNPEITDRLETDLAAGAIVLFTEEEVEEAIKNGQIPEEWRQGLTCLVKEKNDIAIIPKGAVEAWRQQQMTRMMLTQR